MITHPDVKQTIEYDNLFKPLLQQYTITESEFYSDKYKNVNPLSSSNTVTISELGWSFLDKYINYFLMRPDTQILTDEIYFRSVFDIANKIYDNIYLAYYISYINNLPSLLSFQQITIFIPSIDAIKDKILDELKPKPDILQKVENVNIEFSEVPNVNEEYIKDIETFINPTYFEQQKIVSHVISVSPFVEKHIDYTKISRFIKAYQALVKI